jgi:hypothetical protein
MVPFGKQQEILRNLSTFVSPKKIIDSIPFSCRFGRTLFDVSAESRYESGQQRSGCALQLGSPVRKK